MIGLNDYLEKHEIKRLRDIIGTLEVDLAEEA
jgi:hypothetical protein